MSGIGTAAASIAGRVLVTLGQLVALVQTLARLQRRGRPLTAEERALLWNVYRDSIVYDGIRVVEGRAGIFSVNKRPFTLGNTIYLKDIDPAARPDVLVHECCHVWQNQHEGSRYAIDALWAQLTVRPDAYRWADELGRGRTAWQDFNKEAQAQFLQDVHRSEAGSFYDGDPVRDDARFEHGGTDHTDLARATVTAVRGAMPRR